MPHDCWQSPTVHGYFTIGHRRWSSVWHEIAGWVSGQSLIKIKSKKTQNKTKSAKISGSFFDEKLVAVSVYVTKFLVVHIFLNTSLLSLFTPSFSIIYITSNFTCHSIFFSSVVFYVTLTPSQKITNYDLLQITLLNLLFNCCLRNSVVKKKHTYKLCIKAEIALNAFSMEAGAKAHTLAMSEMVVEWLWLKRLN